MVPSSYTTKSNWLESYTNLNALKKSNEASICVVGGKGHYTTSDWMYYLHFNLEQVTNVL